MPSRAMTRLLFSSGRLCHDVEEVAALTGGENSQVIEVRCAGRDRAFVLKVYPDDLRWKMAKEAFVYGLVEPTSGLPTPHILVADDSGTMFPEAYLIMTKLPGTLAAGVLTSLCDRDKAHVYEQIGAILRAFHQITFASFGYLSTEVVNARSTNSAYMEHQFAKKLRESVERGGDQQIWRDAERAVEASASLLAGCYGHHSAAALISMIYLCCGGITVDLPTER